MEYITETTFNASQSAVLATNAIMRVSDGDEDLAIVTTEWTLLVKISLDEDPLEFQLMENLMRSMLAGAIWPDFSIDAYSQNEEGFEVRFTPPNALGADSQRREMQQLEVNFNFLYAPYIGEELFPQLVALCDIALTEAMRSLANLAPSVFDVQRSNNLLRVLPLLDSLKLSLKLEDDGTKNLERVAEFGTLFLKRRSHTRSDPESRRVKSLVYNNETWNSPGVFFSSIPFAPRKFIALYDDDGEATHTPIYVNDLVR